MIPHSKPLIGDDEVAVAMDVLRRGDCAVGPEIEKFENSVADYIGKKYAVAVSNGTAAVHLALLGMNIGQGDEVILPASVCPGVLHAIEYTGAKPVFCDINQDDLNLNFESAVQACSNSTKLIILPHLFGIPSDIDCFKELGIPLMEDCAQSIGAEYRGKMAGAIGEISVFSFYATKMMTAIDGGMILTDNVDIAESMRDLRYYGGKRNYKLRYNYKIQNINAAIGIVQLSRLKNFIHDRAVQFSILQDGLSEVSGLKILPQNFDDRTSSFYKCLIGFNDQNIKDQYVKICDDLKIKTGPAIFVDLQNFYAGVECGHFNNVRMHLENTYSFPLYPGLNMNVVEQFLSRMKNVLRA